MDQTPDVDGFLSTISKIESNGGTNFNHQPITSGPQKGQTAIGTYGLLPNTVDEVATRSGDKSLKPLLDMSGDEKKSFLESNPQIENKVARTLASYVLNRQGGDEQKAAYSWLNGHNLTPDQITQRDYQSSPYVQKYQKLSGQSQNKAPKQLSQLASNVPDDTSPITLPEADTSKLAGYLSGSNASDAEPAEDPSTMAVKDLYTKQQDDLSAALAKKYKSPTMEPIEETPVAQPALPKLKLMLGSNPQSINTTMNQQTHTPTIGELIENLKRGPISYNRKNE